MPKQLGRRRYNRANRGRYRRLAILRQRTYTPLPAGPAVPKQVGPIIRLSGDVATGLADPAEGTESLAMAITTAGREGSPLVRSMESIRGAGFQGPLHVFAEPSSIDNEDIMAAEPEAVIHRHVKQLGCFPNWKHTATWMYENTDADWVLIMQDDITWCSAAAKVLQHAMETIPRSHVGFLSPYTSPAMVPDRAMTMHNVWVHAKVRNFWGAVALCFPRDSLKYLLTCPIFKNHKHHRMVDVVIGDAFYSRKDKRKPMIHVPSLGTHIGEVSTIGRDKNPLSQWGRCGFHFNPELRI